MRVFLAHLIILLAHCFVVLADLKSDLTSKGITAVFPGNSGYATASKAYNLRFTVQPAAVTYPNTPQDVSNIIKIGAAHKLSVVARSGGHSYIANGLGGTNGALVVDLRNLKKITINAAQGSAVIESGNRLGNVATSLNNAGRALPHGTCPYVGIGGHSAFGGFGFTSRMWGLTIDTITALNLVLSNGTIVRATQTNYPDLYWGLRGSASSFGITTSIEVKTFPAPPSSTAFQYEWNMNIDAATNGLAAFQSFAQTNIPAQFGAEVNLGRGTSSGTVYFSLVGGWYGAENDLSGVLAPLLAKLPKNPKVTLKPGTYLDSVVFFAGGSLDTTKPDVTDTFYAKSLITPQSSPLSTSAIKAYMTYLANQGFSTNLNWFCQFELYGGKNSAINAVGPDATAFAYRSSIFTVQLYASSSNYAPPFPQNGFSFVDGMVNAIVSNSPANWPYGAYTNYIEDKQTNWQTRYYGAHYPKLKSLKDKYDPKNIFHFPTSIEE